MIIKGEISMKNTIYVLVATFALFTLTACGGGGGGEGGSSAPTTATLKVNLTGTLPPSTGISGTDFTITLPANVAPAGNNGVVANGAAVNSGTFAASTLSPQVAYTSATASAPGTLRVILVSSTQNGVTQVGEAATIILELANGAVPTPANFRLSASTVYDAAQISPIGSMEASIASVKLQ